MIPPVISIEEAAPNDVTNTFNAETLKTANLGSGDALLAARSSNTLQAESKSNLAGSMVGLAATYDISGSTTATQSAVHLKVTPDEPKQSEFYNVTDSKRLTDRLVNRLNKDITATVGTYDPYPLLWQSAGEVKRKQAVKDVWARTSKRFATINSNLSPGMYTPVPRPFSHTPSAASAFKSSVKRFRMKTPGTSVAPGSYEIDPVHIRHGFAPWVKDVQQNLGRTLEPSISVPWGTPSRLLEKLSNETKEIIKFSEAKKRLDAQIKSNELRKKAEETAGVLNAKVVPAKPLHPFSLQYLVSPTKE
eukprot:jgi/Hompol1/831/HPOL_002579-RA